MILARQAEAFDVVPYIKRALLQVELSTLERHYGMQKMQRTKSLHCGLEIYPRDYNSGSSNLVIR